MKDLGLDIFAKFWSKASAPLQAIADEELRNADNNRELFLLCAEFNVAVATAKPEPYSGLIELQKGLKLFHESTRVK